MDNHLIDLTGEKYWGFLLFALLVYIPLAGGRYRCWAAAALNLLFVKLYVNKFEWIGVVAAAVAVFTLSKLLVRDSFRTAACIALALPTAALFVLHKVPTLADFEPAHGVTNVLATIGFSYVALRMVDMLRNVYERRDTPPSLPETVNYLIPFHMLAAGPIQPYADFVRLSGPSPPLSPTQTLLAVERIAFGAFKKYILAMLLQQIFLTGFTIPGWYMVWEAQVFYIWLYLDFSALSDIAVGIGTLLGIATPENFNRPYFARNLTDFWERWHISLSQFIRRNIFLPIQLGMVRRTGGTHPILCASIAFTIAFALCGLWHQATYRYLLWGLVHASGLVVTNIYRDLITKRLGSKGMKKYLANPWIRIVATILTFEFVAFSLACISIPLKALFP